MIFHRHLPVGVAKLHLQDFLCCVWCLKLSNLTSYHRWLAVAEDRNQILIFLFYFIFSSRGNVIFLLVLDDVSCPAFSKHSRFKSSTSGEIQMKQKNNTEGFIRPEQNTVSVVWGWTSSPLLSHPPSPRTTSQRVNNQHKSMDGQ